MWPFYSHRQSPCWLIWRERRRNLFFWAIRVSQIQRHKTIFSIETFTSRVFAFRLPTNGGFEMVMRYFSSSSSFSLFSLMYLSNGCYWFKTHICICWLRIHDLAVPQLFPCALVLFTRESHNNLIGRTRIMMSFIIRLFEIRAVHNFGCVDGKQFI